jgi:hypothetical protein
MQSGIASFDYVTPKVGATGLNPLGYGNLETGKQLGCTCQVWLSSEEKATKLTRSLLNQIKGSQMGSSLSN